MSSMDPRSDNSTAEAGDTTPNPEPSVEVPEPRESLRPKGFRFTPILIGLIYLAFWQIAPRIPTSSIGAAVVSTIIALALGIWLPAQFGYDYRSAPKSALISAIFAAAIIVPIQVMVVTRHHIAFPWTLITHIPGMPFLVLIWLAASLGALLSFLVRGANMIPPIAAVLALVDIWTVFAGPVGQIISSENPTAKAVTHVMTVPLPLPQPKNGAAPFSGSVGFADFVFVAFFIAAICRFVPSKATYLRTLYFLIAVLSAYMLVVLFGDLNLPALVPMAVTMLALHWRHFHYDRSEIFALVYAAIFIALIAAGFWYLGHQRSSPPNGPAPNEIGFAEPFMVSNAESRKDAKAQRKRAKRNHLESPGGLVFDSVSITAERYWDLELLLELGC